MNEQESRDPGTMALDAILTDGRIDFANNYALELLCSADPVLIDVRPAIDVVEGMTQNTILTSGAPMLWDGYS